MVAARVGELPAVLGRATFRFVDERQVQRKAHRDCGVDLVAGLAFRDREPAFKAVADWLGHASPVVTLSTCAHLMPTDDDVARGVLDAAFTRSADFSRTEDVAGA